MNVRYRYFKVLLVVLLGCALQGCGGGDSGDAAADAPSDGSPTSMSRSRVASATGPLPMRRSRSARGRGSAAAKRRGQSARGLQRHAEDQGQDFPLLLEATGGTDLVTNLPPDFVLKSSALEPGNRVTANLNPFTTVARATAEQMGDGPTSGNLRTALASVTAEFNSGLTTLAAGGVMSTTINDSTLPEIVKSSETLAEILRRVNAVRRASGRNSSIDDVVSVIGADLTDGELDGRGATRTDAHASAAAALASAQVLVEAMTNSLRVNGQPATAAL